MNSYTFLLGLFIFTSSNSILKADEEASTEKPAIRVLMQYRSALENGDMGRALGLTASFPNYPLDKTRGFTKKYVDLTKSGGLHLWIYPKSFLQSGDCAVIIVGIHDNPNPDDPAYMILQDGHWKVLPSIAMWQQDDFNLSGSQKKAFEELSLKFKLEKSRLRQLNGTVETW
jgi:hypothetical protein